MHFLRIDPPPRSTINYK